MATEDDLKKLDARLARLESALAQAQGPVGGTGGFTPPGGAVVDPAPWGGGWRPRWPWPWPWPHPIVDPVPQWPNPIVDPAVTGGLGHLATEGIQARSSAASFLGRVGPNVDPPPIDISRFTLEQLEASLHSIKAEQTRLSAMESMIAKQAEKLRKG